MKTVLHLIDTPGPGGAESVYLELALGLDSLRFRNVVTCDALPDDSSGGEGIVNRGWLHDNLVRRGVKPVVVRTTRPFDLRYLVRLNRLIRDVSADLVHCHLLTSSLYGGIAGRLAGVPVVATFHGSGDIPAHGIVTAAKVALINRCATRIVFVSDHLRRAMGEATGIHAARSTVVHNGVDCDRFRPARSDALRQSLGVPSGTTLVGAVGNVRAPKGYDVLLDSAAMLSARGVPVQFVIAGENASHRDLMETLLAQRARLGLDHMVRFVGFQQDTNSFLNGLDMFVLPSRAEGFSLSTVEAMACGLPVVATRCGGPEEIVMNGDSGLFVPPGDPAALADAIGRVAADPDLRATLGRSARARATTQFSIDRMIQGYEAVYDALLSVRHDR